MSTPPAIRNLQKNDLKLVTFQMGLSYMEPLTKANFRAYFHPLTLAIWVVLASVMIQLLGWWPDLNGYFGKWSVLSPVPAFAATAIPVLFFFDWFHRPMFEENLQRALRRPDMKDLMTYYSQSPASGFYVLEHQKDSIGFIALNANPSTPSKKKQNLSAEIAYIQHFYMEEMYRSTGAQSDLVEFALNRAFSRDNVGNPERVRVLCSDIEPYKMAALRKAKFHPVSKWEGDGPSEWKSGIYKWKNVWLEVTREEWHAAGRQ